MYTNEQIEELKPTIFEQIDKSFPYKTARPKQKSIIFEIVKTYMQGKKFYVLEAPTGFGKSVAVVTATRVISALFPKQNEEGQDVPLVSLICTKTKALQSQYSKDFPELKSLWSASGYDCNRDPHNEEAYFKSHVCDGPLCSFFDVCNYRVARQKFLYSYEGILNYAYFLHFVKHSPTLLVLDEVHNLEKLLVDHLHLKFNPSQIKKVLEKLAEFGFVTSSDMIQITDTLVELLDLDDSLSGWIEQVKTKVKKILPIIMAINNQLENKKEEIDTGKSQLELIQKKTFFSNAKILESFLAKLFRLIKSKVDWVVSERELNNSMDMKPLYLNEEANALFSRCKFCILVSATISGIPQFCKNLGIKEGDYNYVSLNSDVPKENRPVIPLGLKGLSYTNKEEMLPIYVNALDGLVENYAKGQRTLVHSVTYDNAEYIKDNSKYKKRIIIPETEDIVEIKNILLKHPEGIIVSPAVTEGIDLMDDLCRLNVFFKIPFGFLGDKWIAKKREISNDWYLAETINHLVQGCGRGVRSNTDWCINVIMDGNFSKLRYRTDLIPKWFLEALVDL